MNNELGNKNSWKILVVFLVLMIGLTLTIQIVQQNQENRSKAEENDVAMEEENEQFENMCGGADELPALSRPVENLCRVGTPIWIDSVASTGLYRWKCVDEVTGESGECSAVLSN